MAVRSREREKIREKEKRREPERRDDDGDAEGSKDYDRKRRKREDDDSRRTNTEEVLDTKVKIEDLEEEKRELDEEIDKKRKRRVQEWQELKRKKEESEREKHGEEDTMLEGSETATEGGDESDPLDAFMNTMVLPELEKLNNGNSSLTSIGSSVIQSEDSDSDYSDLGDDDNVRVEVEDDEEFIKRVKKTKMEKLLMADHSKIQYPPFRKNFYNEVKEISRMTTEEVVTYRKELEFRFRHGEDLQKPIKTWTQTGLSSKIIKKLGHEKPLPIQAQALPIIMSGRDFIGVAKTGSGKTLAYVLPMLRHIKDQRPVVSGDGPIALIMAPTRELVQQIHSDIRRLARVMGFNSVPVSGGSGVAQQISELKRGAEIVVCTPGRMIDVLCTSNGKITNLRRVTYLVIDEADRMFDMGFEPQITRIVQNTRPDRQTVLFSATFPHWIGILARKVLTNPVKIQIGGRSVVNKDIRQLVEIRPENDRFLRLLELLGEWYNKGKILIFVQSQEKCDSLFKDLLKHGYPCLSLHGAKDQTDRESTIFDFKNNVCNLLVATSIAARGLDVKELELVINYDVPNHYEEYVHRVGRTGRAGRKGCAITFISEKDGRYAADLVKALELSEQAVPEDLKALADGFMEKVNQGVERAYCTGYGGSGFKFNKEEDEVRNAAKKAQAREYGFEEVTSDSEDEGIREAGGADLSQQAARAHPGINLQHNLAKIQADAMPDHYEAEFEINDFPQNARWKVTHKKTLGPISEWTGAAITTRGQYYPPGKIAEPGKRKLYLFIEGPTESSVKKAKTQVKRVLEDIMKQALSLPGVSQPGKYSVP